MSPDYESNEPLQSLYDHPFYKNHICPQGITCILALRAIFEKVILSNVVERSRNYVFEDDNPPPPPASDKGL